LPCKLYGVHSFPSLKLNHPRSMKGPRQPALHWFSWITTARWERAPGSQAPVVHTCNPSYSGDKDQEDHSLKPAQANRLQDPVLKNSFTKKGCCSDSSGGTPA
jgi:hypothetical protein